MVCEQRGDDVGHPYTCEASEETTEGSPPPAVIRAAAARSDTPERRSSHSTLADGAASCGGAEATPAKSGRSVWCLA
jgi:hypothetical protein